MVIECVNARTIGDAEDAGKKNTTLTNAWKQNRTARNVKENMWPGTLTVRQEKQQSSTDWGKKDKDPLYSRNLNNE